jgi:hypothetical protein
MSNPSIPHRFGKATVILLIVASAGLGPVISAQPVLAETAVAPEKNPPGDIPDSQAFVTYANAAGYSLKVPEGWARTETGTDVQFVDKLDAVSVTLSDQKKAISLDQAKTAYVPELEKTGRAVKVESVADVTLPLGHAILIAYSANSEPNPVTSKQVRLEVNRYLIFKAGKMVALDLSARFGADNVDQWQLMSRSFGWK